MVHACRSLIEEQAVEKGGWGGAARGQTARQQLVQVERMAIGHRPLEMGRRVACGVVEFWLMLAWWMLERATDGGPASELNMVGRCKRRTM